MRARIFLRQKTPTQSGQAGTDDWVLEYQPAVRETNDQLMGWWGGGSTLGQVRLRFDTREDAVAYAERHGITYDLEIPPPVKQIKAKVYADNFRFGRADNWTH